MTVTLSDAIVLHAFPYGETSRIVRLLTREAGVQSAIAKGATRPRSRFAVLEPFAEGTASLHIRSTRELQTLSAFDVTRSRQSLGRDLLRFGGASLLTELVMRTGSEDPSGDLYEAVSTGLDMLVSVPDEGVEVAVLAVVWHAVALLGFSPELECCVQCARSIDTDAAVMFDYTAGGARCVECAEGLPGRPLPPHARAALAAFTRGDAVGADVTEGHWRLLRRYLEHHLLEGSTMRSFDFLASSLSIR